jgi:hypothetical protein
MGGQMQSVNEKDVEKVKTGPGMTKFLIQHKRGEGPNFMIRYWGPETYIPVHGHSYDEMWYVLPTLSTPIRERCDKAGTPLSHTDEGRCSAHRGGLQ